MALTAMKSLISVTLLLGCLLTYPGGSTGENVYLLTFYTGSWFMGGTDANIFFKLQGRAGESGVLWLHPSGHQMEVGSVDTFPVTTDYGLITRVMLGHDNSGSGSSWHFLKLVIRDLVRGQELTFACDCWVPETSVTPSTVFTENLDECLSTPCQHGGSCLDLVRNFQCTCAEGWTGYQCEKDINECAGGNPCYNGGLCQNTVPGYSCECPPGYTGLTCESDVDECIDVSKNFCINGATCVNTAPGLLCRCLQGFTGVYCQEDVDECRVLQPCENNSTCVNTYGGYTCVCPEGWTGANCSKDIDKCSEMFSVETCGNESSCSVLQGKCLNNSTCVNLEGGYYCQCDPGFTGSRCDEDVEECLEEVDWCQNGARCTNTHGGWDCTCTDGYRGARCEDDVDECEVSDQGEVCLNGGECNNTIGGYTCTCRPGYTGVRCEDDIDECESHPCLQGGTCHDGANDYSCVCPSGYEGHHCQQEVNECESDPCSNGATCEDMVDGFLCACPPGAEGSDCETATTMSPDEMATTVSVKELQTTYNLTEGKGITPKHTLHKNVFGKASSRNSISKDRTQAEQEPTTQGMDSTTESNTSSGRLMSTVGVPEGTTTLQKETVGNGAGKPMAISTLYCIFVLCVLQLQRWRLLFISQRDGGFIESIRQCR